VDSSDYSPIFISVTYRNNSQILTTIWNKLIIPNKIKNKLKDLENKRSAQIPVTPNPKERRG